HGFDRQQAVVAGQPVLDRAEDGHRPDAEEQAGGHKAPDEAGCPLLVAPAPVDARLQPCADAVQPRLQVPPLAEDAANEHRTQHDQHVRRFEEHLQADGGGDKPQPVQHGLAHPLAQPPAEQHPQRSPYQNGDDVDDRPGHAAPPCSLELSVYTRRPARGQATCQKAAKFIRGFFALRTAATSIPPSAQPASLLIAICTAVIVKRGRKLIWTDTNWGETWLGTLVRAPARSSAGRCCSRRSRRQAAGSPTAALQLITTCRCPTRSRRGAARSVRRWAA